MMRGFATFWANIASLRNEVEQHHFERSEKHHIAAGDASLIYTRLRLDLFVKVCYNTLEGSDCMAKNYLLTYSEQLATNIELLCQNIKVPSNTLFQIRKSSSSVYANIREANYGQSKADMLSKFEIALKECSETEGWLQLLFNTNGIDEETYKNHRNLCGRIRRMLISSCKTLKENGK